MRDKLSRRPDTRVLYGFDRHGDVVDVVEIPGRAEQARDHNLFDRVVARQDARPR